MRYTEKGVQTLWEHEKGLPEPDVKILALCETAMDLASMIEAMRLWFDVKSVQHPTSWDAFWDWWLGNVEYGNE